VPPQQPLSRVALVLHSRVCGCGQACSARRAQHEKAVHALAGLAVGLAMTAVALRVFEGSMASPAAVCCRAPLYRECDGDLRAASSDACCSAAPDLPGPISAATPPAAPAARHEAVALWQVGPDLSARVAAAVWVLLALLCLPRHRRHAGIGAPGRAALGLSVVLTSAVRLAAVAPSDPQQAPWRIHPAHGLSAAGMQRNTLSEVASALPHGVHGPGRLAGKQRRSLLASVQPSPPPLGAAEGEAQAPQWQGSGSTFCQAQVAQVQAAGQLRS